MAMERCGRDQRKMQQVLEQIKMLTNNLDELRAEIGELKNKYLANDLDCLLDKRHDRYGNNETSILSKLKKYAKKIGDMNLPKQRYRSTKHQEVYGAPKVLDLPLLSSLKYIFHGGKKGNVLHIPTEVTCVRDEYSQTNEKASPQESATFFATRNSTASVKNMEDVPRHQAKREIKQYDKIIYPTRRATLSPQFFELSCEVDSCVGNSTCPISCKIRTKSDLKDTPTKEAYIPNENKYFENTSTQTSLPKLKRKHKNFNFRSKHSNLYFSKIKNAMITRKIIRNPTEKTFPTCGNVNSVIDYPYVKKNCYECSTCKTKKINNGVETIDREMFESVKKLKNVSSIRKNNIYENFTSEDELESPPSTIVSVDLEMDVFNSSNEKEYPRRKPRTYTISKTFQNHDENRFDRYENIFYLGQTSDLTLSVQSFQNQHSN